MAVGDVTVATALAPVPASRRRRPPSSSLPLTVPSCDLCDGISPAAAICSW